MYIDELLLYLTVAGISGMVIAMMVRGWNRPFFRANRKATETLHTIFPMPMVRKARRW